MDTRKKEVSSTSLSPFAVAFDRSSKRENDLKNNTLVATTQLCPIPHFPRFSEKMIENEMTLAANSRLPAINVFE